MTISVGTPRPTVSETTVDGVRVLWVDAPLPAQAVLRFRVGRVDETLATAGIGHLTEHLACAGVGERPYAYNASVDTMETAFYATGTPDDVADFLALVSLALTNLDDDRLVVERRILRAEAATRSFGALGMHAALWFGSRGPGLIGHTEVGLNRITPADVRAFSQYFHTAENAVLTLTCPPPPNLRLRLRQGDHRPVPEPHPVPFLRPAFARYDVSTVSMSFVHPRSVAAASALAMAERRLSRRLRMDAGISYGTSRANDRIAPTWMLSVLGSDVLDRHEQQAADLFLATLDDLATNGFRPDELDRERALWATARMSPDHSLAELNRQAFESLLGNDVGDDPWAALDALSVDDVSAAFSGLLHQALFLAPSGVAVTANAHPLPEWSERVVAGEQFPRMTIYQLVDAPKSRVIIGDEGITVSFDDERRLTVRWDECTAAVIHEDGRRVLYGADGFRIVLDPAQWVRGDALAAALKRLVPAHVVVPATVDEPGVPEPGGPPSPAPFAPPAWRPHIPWWRLHGLSTWILALAAVPLALFTLLCATIILFGPTMDDRAVGFWATLVLGTPSAWLWSEIIRRGRDPLPKPTD